VNWRSQACGLLVSVVVSALVGAGWFWWVQAHAHGESQILPPGVSAQTTNGARFHLQSLTVLTEATSGYGDVSTPVPGAVFVLARIAYDNRQVSDEGYCVFWLRAAELQWSSDTYSPKSPEKSTCDPGAEGTVVALFQVPRSYLGRVSGVAVVDPGAPWPVLTGQAT
jgi:hypothetical protein